MTFSETVPCRWCERRLRVRPVTDGNGGLVDMVQECPCPDARWRRGECVECGRRTPMGKRGPRKRCPRHQRERRAKYDREYQRQRYHADPERERERLRRRQRDPAFLAKRRRYERAYYDALSTALGRKRRPRRQEIEWRNAEILRLREAGKSCQEIGEMVGLSRGRIHQICRAAKPEQQKAA